MPWYPVYYKGTVYPLQGAQNAKVVHIWTLVIRMADVITSWFHLNKHTFFYFNWERSHLSNQDFESLVHSLQTKKAEIVFIWKYPRSAPGGLISHGQSCPTSSRSSKQRQSFHKPHINSWASFVTKGRHAVPTASHLSQFKTAHDLQCSL